MFAVILQDLRSLEVSWVMSFANLEERKRFLKTRPFDYIRSVVAHEGPGSLLSFLKRKGWGNRLRAFCSGVRDDFAKFKVTAKTSPA
ncbi:unnamed protein product [Hapterophycus canaliculatus]